MTDRLRADIIKVLDKKYPNRAELVKELSGILKIEQDAVYRRLRKDVSFSLEEVYKIASAWNISLDEITGNTTTFPLSINHVNPVNKEVENIRNIINHFNNPENYRDAEYMEVSNKLPRFLITEFQSISKFQLLKWACQYNSKDRILPFSKTVIPELLSTLMNECYVAIKKTKYTTYILDYRIFESIVHDILYFNSINVISNAEKALVKKELLSLLDYLEEISATGCWSSGISNKVDLYISNISIEANYSYYYSKEFKICHIQAYGKSELQYNTPEIIENLKDWMQTKKKTSDLISGACEKNRLEFFKKQRKFIEVL
jgi:hypothetical protein